MRQPQAGERVRRADEADPRPEPELRPQDRHEGRAGELPRQVPVPRERERGRHPGEGRGGRVRHRHLEHPRPGSAQVRHRQEPEAVLPPELG